MSDNPQDPEEFSIERFEERERQRERERRRQTGEGSGRRDEQTPGLYTDPGAPRAQSSYPATPSSEYGQPGSWNPDSTPHPARAGSEENIYDVSPPRETYTRSLGPVQYGYGVPSVSASSVPPSGSSYSYGYQIPANSQVSMMAPRPSAFAPPSQSYGYDDGRHAPVVRVSAAMESMALGPRDESYTRPLPAVQYGYGVPTGYGSSVPSGGSSYPSSYPLPASSNVGMMPPPPRPIAPRPSEPAGLSQSGRPSLEKIDAKAIWGGEGGLDIITPGRNRSMTPGGKYGPITYKAESLQTAEGDPIFSRITGKKTESKAYYRLKDGILEKYGALRGRGVSGIERMPLPSDPLPLRAPEAAWHGNNIVGTDGAYYRSIPSVTQEGHAVFSRRTKDSVSLHNKRTRHEREEQGAVHYFSLQDGHLRACRRVDTVDVAGTVDDLFATIRGRLGLPAPQQNTPDVPSESHSSAQLGSVGMGGQPAGVTYSGFGDISFSGGQGYNYSSGSQSMAHPQQRSEHAAPATYTQAQQPQQRTHPDSTYGESITSAAPSDDHQQRRRHRADDGHSHESSHGKRGRRR
jgi:hypothetical protein